MEFTDLKNFGSSCTGFTLMRGRTFRYLRTVSGTSPITLLDCIAAYYVSLSVSGNVAADTVKGVGDRTLNLFDKDNITEGARLNSNNAVPNYDSTATNMYTSDIIPVIPGSGYYYSPKGATYATRLIYLDSAKGFISTIDGNTSSIITIPENAYYVRFCGLLSAIDTVMFAQSEVPLPYEPYGYKLPITQLAGGETAEYNLYLDSPLYSRASNNLFNAENYIKGVGSLSVSNSATAWSWTDSDMGCVYFSCKPSTTYTISYNNPPTTMAFTVGSTTGLPSTNTDPITQRSLSTWGTHKVTITTGENDKYIAVNTMNSTGKSIYGTKAEAVKHLNINEGASALPFEVYGTKYDTLKLDIPAHKAEIILNCAETDGNIVYAPKTVTDISAMQDWDSIPLLSKGTNVIAVGTEVEPSAVEVQYYSDKESEGI